MSNGPRARAEFDLPSGGVRVAVALHGDGQTTAMLAWPAQPEIRRVPANVVPSDDDDDAAAAWLHLPEDAARALYDALAHYFGGTFDTAALRRDYDAERSRVDKFITHLTGGAR